MKRFCHKAYLILLIQLFIAPLIASAATHTNISGVVYPGATWSSTYVGNSCLDIKNYFLVDKDYLNHSAYGYINNNISNYFLSTIQYDDKNKTQETGICLGGKNLLFKEYTYKGFGFCFKSPLHSANKFYSSECQYVNLNAGESRKLGELNKDPLLGGNPALKDIELSVIRIRDALCLTMPTTRGQAPLICRILNDESKKDIIDDEEAKEDERCKKTSPACYNKKVYSQSLIHFSGQTIHCIIETLDKVFFHKSDCIKTAGSVAYYGLNIFPVFLAKIQFAVIMLIIFYIATLGIKNALEPGNFDKSQIALSIVKIAFVVYFSIGFGQLGTISGKIPERNGISEYIPDLVRITSNFADIVFRSSNPSGLCDFDVTRYEPGYQFYKLWDAIDCRLGYYFGYSSFNMGVTLIGVIIALILGGFTIITAIALLIFIVLFVSMMLSFFTAYVVSIVTLYVMAYVSPIFIPMILFERTKEYFNAWIRIVISCIVQPAIIIGFLAFYVAIVDSEMYPGCTFERVDHEIINESKGTVDRRYSLFNLKKDKEGKCEMSIGYILSQYYSEDAKFEDVFFLFGKGAKATTNIGSMTLAGIQILVFTIIFSYILKYVYTFASEVTDGASLGSIASGIGGAAATISKPLKAAAAIRRAAKARMSKGKDKQDGGNNNKGGGGDKGGRNDKGDGGDKGGGNDKDDGSNKSSE